MAENVLTLITVPPADGASLAQAAMGALKQLGASLGAVDWLAPAVACDIPFDGLDADQALAAARLALAGQSVDLVSQAAVGRRKGLLVADMESTIIANEMLDEIAALSGLTERVAEITRRAMNGELEFSGAFKERIALFTGLPETKLAEAGARIRLTQGAKELVATMRAHGAHTTLVSGGLTEFAGRVGAALGFDSIVANAIEIADGKLTGKVREPIVGPGTKLEALKRLAAELRLPLAATLAVGDGANDLQMVEAAGLGVAYHAKPILANRARARIDHGDLTALLYAQGYRRDEIKSQL